MLSVKFITFGVLLTNCVEIVNLNSPCILERNQYNEYPWMIKLYWGRTWGHGSLTAPNRVLSAYEPFTRAGATIKNVVQSMIFIATMRGPNGIVICTAKRKGSKLFRQDVTRAFVGFWELTQPFDVGYNDYPFLFKDKDGISRSDIQQNLMSTSKTEICLVPLFKDELKDGTEVAVDKVFLTDINDCKKKFPPSAGITIEDFCVVQPYHHPAVENPTSLVPINWLGGAVILCRNKPLGIIKQSSPPTARGLTVFVSLASSADVLLTQALQQWPTKRPYVSFISTAKNSAITTLAKTTAADTTNLATTNPAAITATVPDTSESITEPETKKEPRNPSTTVMKSPTEITIMIPEAPTVFRPTATPRPSGFIGTPPRKATYARGNMSLQLGNWPLIVVTTCPIILQLLDLLK